ncbi:MAG TPA: hypothetical protein VFJ97_13605 [Dermatophilaceae bacterium]|nr:hypothetical protein [Dermatophilaceae bacterium]
MAAPSVASRSGEQVKIEDDCQPRSFNRAIGPGTCIGDGETSFSAFLNELAATQKAADWKFDPSMLTTHLGRPVILENEGGETHSFTLVKTFGGGFIEPLNQLSGNPVPAPECATTLPDGSLAPKPPSPVNVFVAADRDAAFRTAGLKPGKYMFQCCIHPWMRVVLTVR